MSTVSNEVEIKIEEIELFDITRRIREALEKLQKEFQEEYEIKDLDLGVELGFPSGVKGSLSVKLSKKE